MINLSLILLMIISALVNNGKECRDEYPKGMYLLDELKKVYTYDNSIYFFNMEKIDPYIFREYVYRY